MRLSIITPVLNMEKTIERAVESVQSQYYSDVEHIVVDGGSTDATNALLDRHPHVVRRLAPGSSQSAAMNIGFRSSNGEVVSYLNADDEYEPGAFAEVMDRFQRDEGLRFLVGRLRVLVNDEPGWISEPNIDFTKMLRFFDWDAFPLNPSSYFFRKQVQEAVGDFKEDDHYSMDYRFLLEVSRRFPMHRTDRILGVYRKYPESKTGRTSTDREAWLKNRFTTDYYRYLPLRRQIAAYLWYWTEGHYLPRKYVGRLFGKVRTIVKY